MLRHLSIVSSLCGLLLLFTGCNPRSSGVDLPMASEIPPPVAISYLNRVIDKNRKTKCAFNEQGMTSASGRGEIVRYTNLEYSAWLEKGSYYVVIDERGGRARCTVLVKNYDEAKNIVTALKSLGVSPN